jgi:hypothetical protein
MSLGGGEFRGKPPTYDTLAVSTPHNYFILMRFRAAALLAARGSGPFVPAIFLILARRSYFLGTKKKTDAKQIESGFRHDDNHPPLIVAILRLISSRAG